MAFKNYSSKKESEIKCEVIEKFGKLTDEPDAYNLELRLVKWGDSDPKYDLRKWKQNEDGTEKCVKGVTMDAEELQKLFDVLSKMNTEEE